MKKKIYVAASDLGVTIDGSKNGAEVLYNEYKNEDIFINRQDPSYIKEKDNNNLKKNLNELVKYTSDIYRDLKKLDLDSFILMLGGDHSVAVPSILSSVKRNGNLGLIWIDAHADYHSLLTTTSGNLHGTPCATVNGLNKELSSFYDGEYIKEENTVILGARSVDQGELDNLSNTKVTLITMDEIKEKGIDYCINKAFEIALKDRDGVHISYDIDFIDGDIVHGVSTPVKNGGTINDLEVINKAFKDNIDSIKSIDIVEYNSLNDDDNKTLELTKKIIDNIFLNVK